MSEASKVKFGQTYNRVIRAIQIDQPLNKTNKLANPCSLCNRNVTDSGIVCDTCNKWCHPKCDGMSQKEFQFYVNTSDDPNVKWHCLYCTVKFHRKNIGTIKNLIHKKSNTYKVYIHSKVVGSDIGIGRAV